MPSNIETCSNATHKKLTVSGQVNCPRSNLDIHEIVDNSALDVTLMLVD